VILQRAQRVWHHVILGIKLEVERETEEGGGAYKLISGGAVHPAAAPMAMNPHAKPWRMVTSTRDAGKSSSAISAVEEYIRVMEKVTSATEKETTQGLTWHAARRRLQPRQMRPGVLGSVGDVGAHADAGSTCHPLASQLASRCTGD
jgi:hypothetical protein